MTYKFLFALLLPLAASAQIALFVVGPGSETPIGSVLNFGKVAAGDTASLRIRVRNIGSTPANITYFFVDGIGYTLDRPSLPFPIAPGSLQDVLLSFTQSTVAPLYPANLRIDSDINSISTVVIAAVVVGPALTVFPACTGANGPPPSIDFGLVQAGQLRLCNFSLQNPGAQDMTISTFKLTGAAFQLSTGPQVPFTIPAGGAITFVVNFTPATATTYTGSLAIETRTYALTGRAFNSPLPTPLLEFDSGVFQSAQQRTLTIRLPTAASTSASGSVTFVPDTTLVSDDPAVVFLATGTRSLPFAVTQGSTLVTISSGQTSAMFQTGTTSGKIRFTLSGAPTAGDATTTVTIPAIPMLLDSAIATRRTGDLDIQVTGFDNTYSAGAMTFMFFDTSGAALPLGAIRADFTQDFRAFFTRTQAGSMFQVRVSFPVTGDTSGIGAVDVQLTNSAGAKSQHLVFQ